MENIGYTRLTTWILLDKQFDQKTEYLDKRDKIGYIFGYVDGEIEGYQWISNQDILIYPKHILSYPKYVTFTNQELIRM